MLRLFFLTIIITSTSYFSFGQAKIFKTEIEVKAFSLKISELFKNDSIIELFTEIKKYWPLPENELTDMQTKSISTLNIVKARFGASIGFTKVKEQKISDFALRETYLIRYTKHALRLIFTYYKNNEGWIVNGFTWDDSFAEEFK
jgi:hypothetical protein